MKQIEIGFKDYSKFYYYNRGVVIWIKHKDYLNGKKTFCDIKEKPLSKKYT